MKKYFTITLALVSWVHGHAQDFDHKRIQPYTENRSYWQHNGRPVLLIGGSSEDNLFQIDNLEDELDLIQSVGGNYIRNTMSCRDEGNVIPFLRFGEKYQLNKSNKAYWDRFERFLQLTAERNIFVQIEVWAFHDFTGYKDGWLKNAWNPSNNDLLTEENTRLKSEPYGKSTTYVNNFFMSVPKLNNDALLLAYQQHFVDKLLSISLKYDHVLYCITNEIFSQYSPEWGWYRARYIKQKDQACC